MAATFRRWRTVKSSVVSRHGLKGAVERSNGMLIKVARPNGAAPTVYPLRAGSNRLPPHQAFDRTKVNPLSRRSDPSPAGRYRSGRRHGARSFGHLVLVGGESSQHFFLLLAGNTNKVEGPPQLGCDLVEFLGSDTERAMSFLQAYRC